MDHKKYNIRGQRCPLQACKKVGTERTIYDPVRAPWAIWSLGPKKFTLQQNAALIKNFLQSSNHNTTTLPQLNISVLL